MPRIAQNTLEAPNKRKGEVGFSCIRDSARKLSPHRSRQNELEEEKDNAKKAGKVLAKLTLMTVSQSTVQREVRDHLGWNFKQ